MIDPKLPIRVLSIEDDIDYERLIGTWLQQSEPLKFQVTPAERLADVARHSELDGYDCMLLDLGRPESLGLDTLIFAREIASELPIVVLTAAGDSEIAERSMRSGADSFLVKGNFGRDALIETIVATVDARRGGHQLFGEPFWERGGSVQPAIPMSARIAGDMSDQLACSGSWGRYRRATGLPF